MLVIGLLVDCDLITNFDYFTELGTILKKCIIDTITITHILLIIDTTTITLKKIIVDTITNKLFI